ncbi:helix-turn-helix domain-containing protein [Streptomyces noursei]|uniref:helix-turn-helix domain-containing protein n=1 Tax=Streptomyces noursei TaxID=1971 RepID=UPI0038078153
MTDTITPTTPDPLQLWKPPPGQQMRGSTGEKFKDAVVHAYLGDIKSIRQIAEETGRAYSSIRRILNGIEHSHAYAAGITARKLPAVIGR